jgi:uncharacterized membrane protein
MKCVIASLSLLLVACTAPPASQDALIPAAGESAPVAGNSMPARVTPIAKRHTGQDNVDPLRAFRAFGTEPFWNINGVDSSLTFLTPDDPIGVVLQGERHPVGGGLDIVGISHDGREFVLHLRAGACSDGMSESRYDMTSAFQMGGHNYTGCGEVTK